MAVNNKSKPKVLEEKLIQLKRQEEEAKTKQLAEKLKLPYLNLAITPIDDDDLTILPEEKSKKGNLLVIKRTGTVLNLAAKNPQDAQTIKTIKELQVQGFVCHIFVVSLSGLKKGWARYRVIVSENAPIRGVFIIPQNELAKFQKSLRTVQDLKKVITNLSTTQLMTIVMAGAIEMKASDIHLEPAKESARIRYRIDGLLQNIADIPNRNYPFLLSRIKTLSDMLLNVHDVSQDGRFSVGLTDEQKKESSIDIRVSVLPTGYGESIVMRLLGLAAVKLNLEDLGIKPTLFEVIKNQISRPNGMILTTGPTGSGKTTTLYACLNYVNEPDTKIITVEDPIEYRLEGVSQTQISQRRGHTFATALRAIVRQDPDILMIGEIRDRESAEISVQFALTGHLVFSTIHTNDAAGAIPRLLGLKVDPSSLSSSLNLIMAQRLVRRLCPHCKKEHKPTDQMLKAIKKHLDLISPKSGVEVPKKITGFYQAAGCSQCHGLGYQGRIGVFEFLTVTETIQKAILTKKATHEIQSQAVEQGMLTLIQDSLLRAMEGVTSLDEIERIVGSPLLILQEE